MSLSEPGSGVHFLISDRHFTNGVLFPGNTPRPGPVHKHFGLSMFTFILAISLRGRIMVIAINAK